MAILKVSISVDDEHLAMFADIVKQLRNAGFEVEQELESVGVVTGAADSERISVLRNIPGVSQVEVERVVEIPPPQSKLQ